MDLKFLRNQRKHDKKACQRIRLLGIGAMLIACKYEELWAPKAQRELARMKSIVKLQAAIRGHLVRRQAVDTLYCMQGIVKVQSRVKARHSKASGDEILTSHSSIEKMLRNAFARQVTDTAVNGSKKSSNPSFIAAQSKFEELSSTANYSGSLGIFAFQSLMFEVIAARILAF